MGWFDFLVDVKMPMRLDQHSLSQAVSEIQHAIEIEEECQADERRRAEEWRKANPPSPEEHESIGRRCKSMPLPCDYDNHTPVRSGPPNLKAAVLSFSARLLTYVQEKCDGRGVIAYKRAGIRRNVYSRIISKDGATVGKRTALQFCIGLQLSRPEADLLLKAAGYALSGTIAEDCVFAYCIDHEIWNLKDINCILSQCGEKTIEIPEGYDEI